MRRSGKAIGILVGSNAARSGGSAWSSSAPGLLTPVGPRWRCYDYSGGRPRVRAENSPQRDRSMRSLRPNASTRRMPPRLRRCSPSCALSRSAGVASALRPWPRTRRRCCASCSASPSRSFDPQFSSDAAVRCDRPQHLRGDARLRLPRASGAARAAHARSDADRAGQRRDLRLPVEEGHLLHAGPGVQGQAARAHRRRSRLRHQAPARPQGEESVAVAGRRQDRRRQRGVGEGHQDRPLRLRRADRRASRSSTATRCRSASMQPDLRFLYALAVPNTAAVAREVVEAYGHRLRRASGRAPVRTCSASTSAARRSCSSPIRAIGKRRTCPRAPCRPESLPVAAALKGKKLPIPGRIEANVIEEGQAQWLAFLNREVDLLERLPSAFVDEALVDGKLQPALAAKGIRHEMLLRPNTLVDLLQHGGSGRRRLHAGEDRVAPRDQHGATTRRRRSACC